MATNFPSTAIDSYTAKTDNVDDVMAIDVNNLQDAVVAIETKVGIDNSTVATSLDYKVTHIGTSQIVNGAVTESKIGNGAVTGAKIGSGAVTADKIGSGAVTESKIGSGAVTNTKIADAAVGSTKISNGAVTESKIGSGAVTNTKIADSAITTSKLADNAVTSAKINYSFSTGDYSVPTSSTWTPPEGTYNFVIDSNSTMLRLELNISGIWRGADKAVFGGGTVICDGSNVRFRNKDGFNPVVVYYQKV